MFNFLSLCLYSIVSRLNTLYITIIWYNNKIINPYFNVEQRPAPQFFPFCIILAQPDDGRNYRPKHVAVNVNIQLFIALYYPEN
jgi:hypothetical protein